jgi:hypothetical protein
MKIYYFGPAWQSLLFVLTQLYTFRGGKQICNPCFVDADQDLLYTRFFANMDVWLNLTIAFRETSNFIW